VSESKSPASPEVPERIWINAAEPDSRIYRYNKPNGIDDKPVEYRRVHSVSPDVGEVVRRAAEKINDYYVTSLMRARNGELQTAENEIAEVAAIITAELATTTQADAEDKAKALIRYDLKYDENQDGDLTDAVLDESPNGEYVKYADFASALSRSHQRAIEVVKRKRDDLDAQFLASKDYERQASLGCAVEALTELLTELEGKEG